MKRTLFSLWLVVLTFAVVSAGNLTGTSFKQHKGTVLTDSMQWKASGTILGSYVYVDTIIGSTMNDTTISYEVSGASYIAIQVRSAAVNDDADYTITPQVSLDNGTNWVSLATTFSVDNTAGSEVGGADATATNDVFIVMKYPLMSDSLAVAGGAIVAGTTNNQQRYHLTNGDNLIMGAARFLRLQLDSDGAAATDTIHISAVISRVYE